MLLSVNPFDKNALNSITSVLSGDTILVDKHSNFNLYCNICRIGNYPGTSCSVNPDIIYTNDSGPKYYFINDFSVQDSHWLCPCIGCDPFYLEIVPVSIKSRAISIYID